MEMDMRRNTGRLNSPWSFLEKRRRRTLWREVFVEKEGF